MSKVRLAVERAVKREVRHIKKHFKTDGWPLDWHFINTTIFWDAFGFHLSDVLYKELIRSRSGLTLHADGGHLLLKKGKMGSRFKIMVGSKNKKGKKCSKKRKTSK